YTAVKAAADNKDAGKLAAVEHEMTLFLRLYPDDLRAGEVEGYANELAQYRMERQATRRGRLIARHNGSAAEIAFARAMEMQSFDPEAALAQFEAIVAVFGGEDDGRDSADSVRLAKEQIGFLQPVVERQISEQKAVLQNKLERADQLATTDPHAARQ